MRGHGRIATIMSRVCNHQVMDDVWYWCLEHGTVEPEGACRIDRRLGPYATRDEAANALERTRERNQDWDHDPRWDDDPPDAG